MREWPAVADPSISSVFDVPSLASAIGGRILSEGRNAIWGAAVDSRRVETGNAFFALPGERTDGHRFVADAAQRGAAAVVVAVPPSSDETAQISQAGAAVIAVDDVLVALHRAAAEWRNRFDPLVVGVTGSLAKTSTKEQIAEVLGERWNVLRNEGNENNEIGLPLTLLRLAPEHEAVVLEMGMYMPGDIALLAALARPSIGVVTAVRGSHLERAGSMDEIERGKRQLVEALPADGTAILNADDERVARMSDHLPEGVAALTYGFAANADVRADEVESLASEGMRFHLLSDLGSAEVTMPALGRHSVHNALAAAATAMAAGLDLDAVVAGLARPWNAPHRTALIDLGPIKVLDDSYNASPDSMIAALDLLATLPGRHVAILGEMLELGPDSVAEHRRIERHARDAADLVIAIGPYEQAEARETVMREIGHRLLPGDVVLIKGSRGAAMEQFLPALQDAAQQMKTPVA